MNIRSLTHKDAKLELLRRVPLFAQCSQRELARIASVADELHVRAGRRLTVEGKPGREFFLLVDGAAEVRRKNRRVATLGAGDFFGEIALLSDRPRTASVTTTDPSRLLVLTGRDFRTLVRETPSLAPKVLAAVADRLPGD